MSANVLIIEDEPAIREMVRMALEMAGLDLMEAGCIQDAQRRLAEQLPDLVLLDWMLPDGAGVDYARRLKKDEATAHLPVIMLTARGEEEDKIRGLESGADDYVTKPFSPRELIARIKAVLRRTSPQFSEEHLQVEGLVIDGASHRVHAEGASIDLGPTEYRLLHFFMHHPERVYSRSQLLDRIWGGSVYIDERTVDVHIRRLRKALEASGYDRLIQTVRGAGYRFSSKV
ncbi:MAG: phosphate regulon transcriptional regulatory protein PhoB [Gammaproteobacteria bacterium RBG_16_57_12]|nr:MAG: phosphate regulon transcriptional regulatory protein PhoB [Gammaproteobacteria bacterium RBG_16_57_12]